jgi:hypothetical protein
LQDLKGKHQLEDLDVDGNDNIKIDIKATGYEGVE